MIIVIFVAIYFIIGGVATALVNKRKPSGSRDRWTKYFAYLVIVFIMLVSIETGWSIIPVIVITGFYEIIKIGRKQKLWAGLIVYAIIMAAFIPFSRQSTKEELLLVYVTILIFDGFSQIAGQLFGKTKLAPSISPGKTIEGLIGGFIIAVATAYFIWDAPVKGMIICVAGLAGDLLASFYKRKCGVKDYSNIIPGHGGVLDRFDSFIFAGALWFVIY